MREASEWESSHGKNGEVGILCPHIIHILIGEILEEFESTHVIGICRRDGCHAGFAGLLSDEVGGRDGGALVGAVLA